MSTTWTLSCGRMPAAANRAWAMLMDPAVVAEFAGFLGATDALLDHLKSYVVAAGPSVAGGAYQHLSAKASGVLTDRSGLASRPARLARLPVNRR